MKSKKVRAGVEARSISTHPVSMVRWVPRESLRANDYNPNHVAPPELELLLTSILEDGWTQPIVVRDGMEIVDGFHRWTLSGRQELLERDGGMVPVVELDAAETRGDQMLSTIRHNRARGRHGVLPMAHIVRSLVAQEGLSREEIQERCGMEEEEVERLNDHAGMPERVTRDTPAFGKAWVPTRDRTQKETEKP